MLLEDQVEDRSRQFSDCSKPCCRPFTAERDLAWSITLCFSQQIRDVGLVAALTNQNAEIHLSG